VTVFCPFCRAEHPNPYVNSHWKPNLSWHSGKHLSRPFTIADMGRLFDKGKEAIQRINIPAILMNSRGKPVASD